jgi:hypothetical protein
MRRVLAHAFSDKAMRDQEPLIQKYVNMLTQSLHIAAGRGPVNIVQWYEFVTFDIIGINLVPGKPRSSFYLLMCLGDLTFGKTLELSRRNLAIGFPLSTPFSEQANGSRP